MAEREVVVPEIGEFEDVDVIEVLVAPGDRVEAEQSLVTLESDKATMEIPSPFAGTVKELLVAVGDKVSEGTRIVLLEAAEADAAGDEAAARPATTQPMVRGHRLRLRRTCSTHRAKPRRSPSSGRSPHRNRGRRDLRAPWRSSN